MPELMRAIANRLREVVGNRRYAPRYRVRLAAAVSLLDARARAHPASLEGHTHDISDAGVALILPAIRVGDRYLTGEGQMLRVMLKLPEAAIQLHGVGVRYERLEKDGENKGYLIGVHIEAMSDTDRAFFDEFLKTLKG
ncbi:MAG TPA: PilZ domain-containing protein [Pyrinomonadaceae bacterium]|jgi:hypothetical protein|nr:PilZ domain-containing protein [Pyrinomonadaceae bacterium]